MSVRALHNVRSVARRWPSAQGGGLRSAPDQGLGAVWKTVDMAGPAMPPMEQSLTVQREGLRAIQDITGRFDDADWQRPTPCEKWNASELAGHVLTVTGNWHGALDDAERGTTTNRFAWDELPARNDESLAALPPSSGPERISQFVERAEAWCVRAADLDQDLPLPIALQDISAVPLTVGLFAWIGGWEWHVHAWDFAQVIGEPHRPMDVQTLYDAALVIYGRDAEPGDPWERRVTNRRPV